MSLAEAQTLAAIAEVMRETASELELLGADLCADPELLAKHCRALQSLDVIAQRQNGIAEVLEGECRVEIIERVPLERLRERLRPQAS